MIVAVKEPSFNLAKQKLFYTNPESYHTKSVSYLAFYRLKPISAVTHYGEVAKSEITHYSKHFKAPPFWLKRNASIKCYYLNWLKELPTSIKRTEKHNSVIKSVYTNLETLLNAKTLTDIFRH